MMAQNGLECANSEMTMGTMETASAKKHMTMGANGGIFSNHRMILGAIGTISWNHQMTTGTFGLHEFLSSCDNENSQRLRVSISMLQNIIAVAASSKHLLMTAFR